MDIERIQKINTLAIDLMRQGLATDREDAVVQAEKVFRSREVGDGYPALRETMDRVESEKQPSSVLNAEKFQEIMEQNTKFLVAKIKEFQEKVTSLENEISSLKNKMTYLRPAAEISSSASHSHSSGMSAAASSSGQSSPPPATHPRSGNYKEQDVSIEKFFYMGGKK